MSCTDKSTVLNLLSFRKSLYLDDLKESIPKPRGTEPKFDLPKFRRLPLDSKIPMIPGLQDNYVLTRRKLGESLRLEIVDRRRFDTSDPHNHEIKLPYEGMHDPHLTRFFRDAVHVRDMMIKTGLVTGQLDVKCSLSEYNAYRNYLRMMHGKLVKKELEKRDEMQKERLLLNVSEDLMLKKNESLKKDEIRISLLEELKLNNEKKLQEILEKQKQDMERVMTLNAIKIQSLQRRRIASKMKRDLFRQKRAIMAKRDQQKILNTLKEWHERDYLLRKTKEQNVLKKRNQKAEAALLRFEQKKKSQEESIEQEIMLKDCAEQLKQLYISEYKEKLMKSRKKLQELLMQKKEELKKRRTVKKRAKKKQTCCCKAK